MNIFVLAMLLFILSCSQNTDPAYKVREGNSKALDIVGGGYHMCAILEDYKVKCWGDNQDNQLNLKIAKNVTTKSDLSNAKFSKIVASDYFTCGILKEGPNEGIPFCFGKEGEWLNVPHEKVKDIAIGENFSCFIKDDGKIKCVGSEIIFVNRYRDKMNIKAKDLVKHGIDPILHEENQDFSNKKFKNLKASGRMLCAQSSEDEMVYCMGNNPDLSAGSITEKVLDYLPGLWQAYFILENGHIKIVGNKSWDIEHIKNISDPTTIKYKKLFFTGHYLAALSGSGNKYDDGSNMPENTLLAAGRAEENVLGFAKSDSRQHKTITCFIKGNHKIKCRTNQESENCPLMTNIP